MGNHVDLSSGVLSCHKMISLRILSRDDIESIHSATLEVLEKTGLSIKNETTRNLLRKSGCTIEEQQVKIPPSLVEDSIHKVPPSFDLYNRDGSKTFPIGSDNVLYTPGSSVVYFKDRKSREIRKGTLNDCVELVQLVDNLEHLAAQSTALVPSDVPERLSGLYRLYVILKHSKKPIVTGAFRKEDVLNMKKMLEASVGGSEELVRKPQAIFDCCPTSPLSWDDTASQHLMDCCSSGIPAAIVPAPLIGATSPITIQGTLVQTNAEILGGVVISQLTKSGSPIIYGGAPGSFDMKYGTPRFSAVESMLVACASAEMGKHYGLPTHAYLGTSDAKVEDSQSGFETGVGAVIGAISRINVISGPGMLAQLNCQSLEKLVIDNEICGSALRFLKGLDFEDFGVVTELIAKVGSTGDYLRQKHTSKKLRSEHFMPTDIIDRLTGNSWIKDGSKSSLDRAMAKVTTILNNVSYEPPAHVQEIEDSFELLKKNRG